MQVFLPTVQYINTSKNLHGARANLTLKLGVNLCDDSSVVGRSGHFLDTNS